MKTKPTALSAFSNPRVLAGLVMGLAGLALGFFAAIGSPPVVITVNTLLDETTSGDGLCSLREAITNANDNAQTYPECAAGSGANAITFSVSGTITLGSTLPAINDDVTIDGGGQSITVSGNNSVRVMFVNNGKTLTLHNLTLLMVPQET
jgi:CSLREA domain-containing protein